jgi:hypothetical protein
MGAALFCPRLFWRNDMHSFTSPDRIIAALTELGFICLDSEAGMKPAWILDDAREIQGFIFKCAAGWYSIQMDSEHSMTVENSISYDGDIGHPEYLAEFKTWLGKQTKLSPYW